jgi:ParB family chromosome partitioning protein
MVKKEETTEIKPIKIDDLIPPRESLRTTADEDKIKELILSIKRYGLIHPIVVFKKGAKYEIFAGHRRFIACKHLQMKEIPCYIRSASEADRDFMKLQENTVREDVNPVDQARHLQRMIDKYGYSQDELAKEIGKARPTVTNLLRLLRYPDYLREAVETGKINQMIAHILAAIDDPTVLREYVRFAVRDGLSQETARQWVQNFFASREQQTRAVAPSDKPVEETPRERYVPKCFFCGLTSDKVPLTMVNLCKRCEIDIPEILGRLEKKE